MTGLSKKTLRFMRDVVSQQNTRPLGALLLFDPTYPDQPLIYKCVITGDTISIDNSTQAYDVKYVGKSTAQVAAELSASPYPIEVRVLAEIKSLKAGELVGSGERIPVGFDIKDRTADGGACIVRVKRWSVAHRKLAAMTIRAPYDDGAILPWWGRISKGSFVQEIKGIRYVFGMPEYDQQTWSETAGFPFADIGGEPAKFINGKTVQLRRFPVLWRNNNIVFVASDSEKVYPASIIKDVDPINGRVYLHEGVTLPGDTQVFYTYLERHLIYKDINLNPHFLQNPFVADKFVLFYALPILSSSGKARSRGIYHSVGESLEEAISAIDNADPGEPITLVGAIHTRSHYEIEDYTVIDTRTYGGGLTTDGLGKATEEKFDRSQFFFDIGRKEGIPYPGAAAVVIDLPPELKEVMTVAEIKERASKYVAAGVYQIYDFREDEYNDQFVQGKYSADISEAKYDLEPVRPLNLGGTSGQFGSHTDAAWWINENLQLPAVLYSGYSGQTLVGGATLNTGLKDPYIQIPAGTSVSQAYIRSRPDAVFSYEVREEGGPWERKTVRDERDIPAGTLAAGHVEISADMGYKEMRNFTGFAPYRLDHIRNRQFLNDLGDHSAQIISNIQHLTENRGTGDFYLVQTRYVDDITTNKSTVVATTTGSAGLESLYHEIADNYDVLYDKHFYSGLGFIDAAARYIFNATSGQIISNRWPKPYDRTNQVFIDDFEEYWEGWQDFRHYLNLARVAINKHAATGTSGTPSIYHKKTASSAKGVDPWGAQDNTATYLWSGCFNASASIELTDRFTGEHLTYKFHTRETVAANASPFSITGNNTGEIQFGWNDAHRQSDYIVGLANMYAAQTVPDYLDYDIGPKPTGNLGLNQFFDGVYTHFSPRNTVLSGMAKMLAEFPHHITGATLEGDTLPDTWFTKWNRIGTAGAYILDNLTESFDRLYYGNQEWAGWIQTGAKTRPFYNEHHNKLYKNKYDTVFRTGESLGQSNLQTMEQIVSGFKDALNTLQPYIEVGARRGGITNPSHYNALRPYVWMAQHCANQDELFTGHVLDQTGLIKTFEDGMAATLHGDLSEDGILIEGGGFKHRPAPFSGQIPRDMFYACADAIKYYRTIGDTAMENKWTALGEGLFRTTTGLYNTKGGYPFDPHYSILGASGDPGSRPLGGYLRLMGALTGVFTDDEAYAVTGGVSPTIV